MSGENQGDSDQKEELKNLFVKYVEDRKGHVLWITVSIALIIAIYFAYLEAISPNTLDMFVPRGHIITTQPENGTTKITTIVPERSHPPFIPRFVILWGFIAITTSFSYFLNSLALSYLFKLCLNIMDQ